MGVLPFIIALWTSLQTYSLVTAVTCEEKQYLYNSNCWDCDSKCDKGTGSNTAYCTSNKFDCTRCLNSFVQMSDDKSCTDLTEKYSYYSDLVNHMLAKCDETSNCMNCKDSPTICTDCYPGYVFSTLSSSCTQNCLDNYYPSEQKQCKRCADEIPNCLTCISQRSCKTCQPNYVLFISPTTGEFSCVKSTSYPSYYVVPFLNSMSILDKCDNECTTCDGSPSSCTECSVSYLASSESSPFYCIQSCADGYFYSTMNQNCQQCTTGCLICDETGSCLLCSSDKYLVINSQSPSVCVTTCPDGYFADEVSLACIKCHQNCRTCFGPTQFGCLDCSSSLFVKIGSYTCVANKCGDGLIALGSEECDDGNKDNYDGCSSTCKVEHGWTCSPSTTVISNNFISKCKTICGDGVRVSPKVGGIEACDTKGQPGCDKTSCQVLEGYTCSRTDESTPDVCTYLCDSNCLSCKTNYGTTTTGICVKCSTNYYANENKCYTECPGNLFQDSTTGFCTVSCNPDHYILNKTCLASCPDGYIVIENQCIKDCPDGSYKTTNSDTNSIACEQCHFTCGTCTGPTSSDCLTCNSGFITYSFLQYRPQFQQHSSLFPFSTRTRYNGSSKIKCVLQCNNGFRYNSTKKECEVCIENCDSCTNGLYQLQDDCVEVCPSGTTQSTSLMKCIIFDNPQVTFEFSPEIKDNVIGINSDLTITAKVSSVYPITSMLWSVENQSPSFLDGQSLTTNSLVLSKSLLEYNMKITLKFTVQSAKGEAFPLLTLSTYTKPAIITKLLVNGSAYKILNHFSDTLTIATDYWPSQTQLLYNIYCVGQSSGKTLQIASGTSSKNLEIKYIFPYLSQEEIFSIEIELSNQELQLTVSDTVRVQIPSLKAETIEKIVGSTFDVTKLTFPQMEMISQTLNQKYSEQLSLDTKYSEQTIKLFEYLNKLSIPLDCSASVCGTNGQCSITQSTPQTFTCGCSSGYSGRFCTLTSDEKTQVDSFGTALSNSLEQISKTESGADSFLSLASEITGNPEFGTNILKTVSSQILTYADLISTDKLSTQYPKFVSLIGKVIDGVLISADRTSSEISSIQQNAIDALDSLNSKRMSSLNKDSPSLSSSYGSNLKTYLLAQNSSDYSNTESLNFHSNWAVQDALRRRLDQVSVNGYSYNVTGLLQNNTIESEIVIPTGVIQAASLVKIEISLNRWRFNPMTSDQNSEFLVDFESDFIQLKSNLPESAIQNLDSTVQFKVPRSRTSALISNLDEKGTNDSSDSVSGNYKCVNYNDSSQKWVDSECTVSEESQYHISCDCSRINTVVFVKRNFEIFFPPKDSSKDLAEKIASNSGLWMCVAIVLVFGFCWLGVKDSNSVGEINKRAFRRTTPLLTILFMNYPMKPVRFRILEFICTILTPFLIESVLYLASGSDPSTDSIPGYAIIALIVVIPINYAIGKLSHWAQYSQSEERLFIELAYERSSPEGINSMKYHIVSSEQEADTIRKEAETSKKDMSITINQNSKSVYSISKEQNSQISSRNPGEDNDVVSQVQPKQIRHLFMMPDFIQKRVWIFNAVTISIAALDAILTIVIVGSLPSDQGVSYFVGSAIFGIILDIFILDIVMSVAAQFQKQAFRFVKLRGFWFRIPNDIIQKKTISVKEDDEMDKSSIQSKAQSNNRESDSHFALSDKLSQKAESQIELKKPKNKQEFNVYLDNEGEDINSRQGANEIYSNSEQKHENHQNQNI